MTVYSVNISQVAPVQTWAFRIVGRKIDPAGEWQRFEEEVVRTCTAEYPSSPGGDDKYLIRAESERDRYRRRADYADIGLEVRYVSEWATLNGFKRDIQPTPAGELSVYHVTTPQNLNPTQEVAP